MIDVVAVSTGSRQTTDLKISTRCLVKATNTAIGWLNRSKSMSANWRYASVNSNDTNLRSDL